MTDDDFWKNEERENPEDLRELLAARAKTGVPMEGFCLGKANLEGVDLVRHQSKDGYQLINSNLYRANLSRAHCFRLDFSGSSLMKANLSHANLHCANLENCNLLGTNVHGYFYV